MKKTTVLIVEDEESIRTMYKDAFIGAGLEVFLAHTGEEALERALSHHPDCILMDINMPGMNGHEAVAKIRHDTWGKTVPIVFLTNMTDAEHVVKAVEAGSEEYIIKANVTPKEVVNRVRMAIHS